MEFLKIRNVKIQGVAACIPSNIEENKDYPFFAENELDRKIPTMGRIPFRIHSTQYSIKNIVKAYK